MKDLESEASSGFDPRYVYSEPSQLSADQSSVIPVQTESPLLRLPAEIRNMIYAHTLGGHSWSISMSGGKPHADNHTKQALALLQVNRQIYSETHLHPYLHNTFEGRHIGHLREWIQSLSNVQRNSISTIKFHLRGYIVQGAQGPDVNATFWMEVPRLAKYNLAGLKKIEIELALRKWASGMDEKVAEEAKSVVMHKLRDLLEEEHSGVMLEVVLKRGF